MQTGLGSTRRGGCPQGARGSQEASSVLEEPSWPFRQRLIYPAGTRGGEQVTPGSAPAPCWRRSVGQDSSSSCLSQIPCEWAPPSVHCADLRRGVSRKGPPLTFGLEAIFIGCGIQANSFPFGTLEVLLGVHWLASVLRETCLPCSCCVMVLPPQLFLRLSPCRWL